MIEHPIGFEDLMNLSPNKAPLRGIFDVQPMSPRRHGDASGIRRLPDRRGAAHSKAEGSGLPSLVRPPGT